VHRTGDHQIVLGEVTSTIHSDDIAPLLYGMRRFSEWETVV
jgi:flavin reductase (DIM6/NTAB) family NADH-FMN oxidoreductase RutF